MTKKFITLFFEDPCSRWIDHDTLGEAKHYWNMAGRNNDTASFYKIVEIKETHITEKDFTDDR
jgi:hypothetical protein